MSIEPGDLAYDEDGDFYEVSTQEYLECSDLLDYIKGLESENALLATKLKGLEDVDEIAAEYRDIAAKAIDLLMEYSHKENRELQKEFEEVGE